MSKTRVVLSLPADAAKRLQVALSTPEGRRAFADATGVPVESVTLQSLNQRVHTVNGLLVTLGKTYHESLTRLATVVSDALHTSGFRVDSGLAFADCAEGRLHLPVGEDKWLSATWYRMPSGRYEVVAYVS